VSIAGISLPLQIKQIDSGTPLSAISQWREAYCRYKSQNRFPAGNAGKLSALDLNGLSVICSGRPIELDKPHILALATETSFLLFKKQVLLKFKQELSVVQCERKTFRLISLSTPVSFCWTVPLRRTLSQKTGKLAEEHTPLIL
jgi:hypothetical protein